MSQTAGVALNEDVVLLKRVWLNEKSCPEILPYQTDLIARLLQQIQLQEQTLAERQRRRTASEDIAHLEESLYKLDLDRVKFVLKDYLRTRLSKIEQYVDHFLETPDMKARLSQEEIQYAEGFRAAMHEHLFASLLSFLPERFRDLRSRITDWRRIITGTTVPRPDPDRHVFVRVLSDVGDVQVTEDAFLDLNAGEVYAARYGPLQHLLLEDKISLI